MPTQYQAPWSGIPTGREKSVRQNQRVDLIGVVELLLKHLTPALCATVFKSYRRSERERKWTFYAVALFWVAMLVRQPSSIKDGVHQTRKGRGRDKLWPRVNARARAFFDKAAGQRPELFLRLYRAFLESILPEAPSTYASWMKTLRRNFTAVYIVDGSRLDAVRRRLKIVWNQHVQLLPGCVTVFYDLFRGVCREILFCPNAAEGEQPRGQAVLERMPAGALIVGDRLYANLKYFHALAKLKLFGLFRRNRRVKIRKIEVLSRKQGSRSFLEDVLVEMGGIVNERRRIKVRLIRYRGHGRSLDLLTDVLDAKKLSAEDAVSLYGLRWSVERLFLDLKKTLDLHTLYASHPNLVAQQVYAAAMVHAAFRIAQAKIALKAKVLPEQLSPAKLFPQLARAIHDYCVCQVRDEEIKRLNPGVKIRFPSLRSNPSAYAKLESIVAERRNPHRRKRKRWKEMFRWKSYAHVKGGPTLLKST